MNNILAGEVPSYLILIANSGLFELSALGFLVVAGLRLARFGDVGPALPFFVLSLSSGLFPLAVTFLVGNEPEHAPALEEAGSPLSLMVIPLSVLLSFLLFSVIRSLTQTDESINRSGREYPRVQPTPPSSVDQLRVRQEQSAADPVVVSRAESSPAKPAEGEPAETKPGKRKVFLD